MDPSDKNQVFDIIADIQAITCEKDFLFPSCEFCKKKLVKNKEGFQCEKCKKTFNHHYETNVNFTDGTGNIWVQAYGEWAEMIIGYKADYILEKIRKEHGAYKIIFESARCKVIMYICYYFI